MTALRVLAIPAFEDNYFWLIHDGVSAAIVDPGDAAPVLATLAAHQLSLVAILLTHHHADHVGGVIALLQRWRVPVYGPRHETIAGVTNPLGEGDGFTIAALDLECQVLDVPGHTAGHIAYVAPLQNWLFCGDTLFAGGCGRLFEGTPAQMAASLDKLAALPESTLIFCAHEYTMANLRFAREVDPDNRRLQQRIVADQEKRELGRPTVPSTLAVELATNPFLRWRQPAVLASLQHSGRLTKGDHVAAFAALRAWKNTFR